VTSTQALEVSNFFCLFEAKMLVDGRSNLANFAKKQRTRYWQAYLKGGEKVEHVEHPEITRTLNTGYPHKEEHEYAGVDFLDTEIFVGDNIVEDPNTGETVLKENLEQYLADHYGFQFKTAK
jgi:predicted Ser/Thr protein kinase